MRFYHGSGTLFNEFSNSYSNYDGKIYVSPCKMMALSYTAGDGYLYEVEISEEDVKSHDEISECGCMAFLDVSKLKIVGYERIDKKLNPFWETECGRRIVRTSRFKK